MMFKFRIIESTLRSINNLLERFHQSFFFYLLPSSNYYISIGMYMPAFGLVVLPILIQIITIWSSLFFKKKTINFNKIENV
jgi:glycosylphosphatidylinositol transamidase